MRKTSILLGSQARHSRVYVKDAEKALPRLKALLSRPHTEVWKGCSQQLLAKRLLTGGLAACRDDGHASLRLHPSLH